MCGDCHTPQNEKGEPIEEQNEGTELPFTARVPMPWADGSVNIAWLPVWERDAAVKFFMTGIANNRLPALHPIQQYPAGCGSDCEIAGTDEMNIHCQQAARKMARGSP
jgi:hypothetical protein